MKKYQIIYKANFRGLVEIFYSSYFDSSACTFNALTYKTHAIVSRADLIFRPLLKSDHELRAACSGARMVIVIVEFSVNCEIN